jgi:hypothetical protein
MEISMPKHYSTAISTVVGLVFLASLTFPISVRAQDWIGNFILDANRKCGPLSGRTPNNFTEDQKKYCDGLVIKLNQLMGTDGSGFALNPAWVAARNRTERWLAFCGKVAQTFCEQDQQSHDCEAGRKFARSGVVPVCKYEPDAAYCGGKARDFCVARGKIDACPEGVSHVQSGAVWECK